MQLWFSDARPRCVLAAVLACAAVVAVVSARPYAGSWNDGAALAMIESLVDERTLAIDRSIFVEPQRRAAGAPPPYTPGDALLEQRGTLDKVRIDRRWYAAKPLAPGVLLAGPYWALQQATGLCAARSPRAFVYWMTLLSSGVAYVVAVGCVYELSRRVLGGPTQAAALAASFGLGSLALAYARHVNGHLPQLAAVAALWLALEALRERLARNEFPCGVAALVGTLAGLAYVFDQGVGPALVACVLPLAAWRTCCARRGVWLLAVVVLAAAPWLIAQHGLNYAVGGTIAAINSRPEHLAWPGSPWNAATMSGVYSHASPLRCASYAAQMLVGKKGFLLHNPLLLAAVVANVWLVARRIGRLREMPELLCGAAFAVLAWGVYSWGSTNYSGGCLSVRWLLPLVAPGYYALAIYLRERPEKWGGLGILGGWSMALQASLWWCGPWYDRVPPGLWLLLAAMLMSWLIYANHHWPAAARGWKSISGGAAGRRRWRLAIAAGR